MGNSKGRYCRWAVSAAVAVLSGCSHVAERNLELTRSECAQGSAWACGIMGEAEADAEAERQRNAGVAGRVVAGIGMGLVAGLAGAATASPQPSYVPAYAPMPGLPQTAYCHAQPMGFETAVTCR